MTKLNIRTYRHGDEVEVIKLWRECGLIVPWNNPETDIARKCADSPELFFIAELGHELVASCMAGYDGHRGWIYHLAVHPEHQREGLGREMMQTAERRLLALGCPKIRYEIKSSSASPAFSRLSRAAARKIPWAIRLVSWRTRSA